MEQAAYGLFGAVGTVAFFAFCAFAVWIDYRKKKEEREAAHEERMKSLELGRPLPDAEIERAKAYASAAWAAGLVGLLVPLAVVALTVTGTCVAVVNHQSGESIAIPLVIAWSIAGGIVLVAVVLSLNVIRQLPRPTPDAPARTAALNKTANNPMHEFGVVRPQS